MILRMKIKTTTAVTLLKVQLRKRVMTTVEGNAWRGFLLKMESRNELIITGAKVSLSICQKTRIFVALNKENKEE